MIFRFLLIAYFAVCLPCAWAYAEAPLVDDSENFALLDEQQAAEQPVAHEAQAYNDEQPALAKDDSPAGSNEATLINKIQGLQQDIQELRGQLEEQAHQLKSLQEQQLAFYKDLDARIGQHATTAAAKKPVATELAIEPTPTAATIPATTTTRTATIPTAIPVVAGAPRGNPADEQISYLAAYDLVKNKNYEAAISAMQNFVNKYPQGGYTANAQYWLGELYLVKKDYPLAQEHFNTVLNQFPNSTKYSASMLKLGYALAASGKTTAAKQRLQEVLQKYPDTPTAKLASAKLATLGG